MWCASIQIIDAPVLLISNIQCKCGHISAHRMHLSEQISSSQIVWSIISGVTSGGSWLVGHSQGTHLHNMLCHICSTTGVPWKVPSSQLPPQFTIYIICYTQMSPCSNTAAIRLFLHLLLSGVTWRLLTPKSQVKWAAPAALGVAEVSARHVFCFQDTCALGLWWCDSHSWPR